MSEETRQYVVFRLGDEDYGVPIGLVSSIIRYQEATPVPHAPPEIQGVINLRGRVVPVVDLKAKLAEAPIEPGNASRIVVTESEVGPLGLAVDAATEVTAVPVEEIRPAPESTLTEATIDAFEGVVTLEEERLIILLRLDRVVPTEAYARLAQKEGDNDV